MIFAAFRCWGSLWGWLWVRFGATPPRDRAVQGAGNRRHGRDGRRRGGDRRRECREDRSRAARPAATAVRAARPAATAVRAAPQRRQRRDHAGNGGATAGNGGHSGGGGRGGAGGANGGPCWGSPPIAAGRRPVLPAGHGSCAAARASPSCILAPAEPMLPATPRRLLDLRDRFPCSCPSGRGCVPGCTTSADCSGGQSCSKETIIVCPPFARRPPTPVPPTSAATPAAPPVGCASARRARPMRSALRACVEGRCYASPGPAVCQSLEHARFSAGALRRSGFVAA